MADTRMLPKRCKPARPLRYRDAAEVANEVACVVALLRRHFAAGESIPVDVALRSLVAVHGRICPEVK